MAATPRYRIQLLNFDTTTFGPGTVLAEIENAKNVGWSRYLNDIDEAFFTIDQDDPKIKLLRGKLGRLHVRIYRNSDLVWTGWAGMEHDSTRRDCVIFCYGYTAGLFWLSSEWEKEYTNTDIGTIVSDAWTRAKTTLTSSPLAFVDTGSIQVPRTTSAYQIGEANLTTDTITCVAYQGGPGIAHGLVDGDRITFQSKGYVTGMTEGTVYYVRDATTTTFKITATAGGTAVNLTGATTAALTWGRALVLPKYTMYYKRLLMVMREMAAVGMGDTTNRVVFDIAPSLTPAFTFRTRYTVYVPFISVRYGDGAVKDFRDYQMPVYRRNQLLGVGSAPSGTVLKSDQSNSSDISSWGRRQEPIYFSWVRDQTELDRAMQHRLALATRDQIDLSISFHPNSFTPPGVPQPSGYQLADKIRVRIDRGITNIDHTFLTVGVQVVYDGVEHTKLMLRQDTGS